MKGVLGSMRTGMKSMMGLKKSKNLGDAQVVSASKG